MEWLIALIAAIAITVAVMRHDIDHLNEINPPTAQEKHEHDERAVNTRNYVLVLLVAAALILAFSR